MTIILVLRITFIMKAPFFFFFYFNEQKLFKLLPKKSGTVGYAPIELHFFHSNQIFKYF